MKRILALLVIFAMLMTTLASCDWFDGDKPTPPECTEHTDADENYVCDNCGAELEKPDVPPSPPVCEEHKDEDGDYKCDACDTVMFEDVKYVLNVSDIEAGKRDSNDINGKFTIGVGTEVRNRTKSYEGVEYTKSIKLGGSGQMIVVSVPGPGTLKFIVQNGSSGAAVQYVKVTSPDGTVSEVQIPGTDEGSPTYMVELEVTEGEWKIERVSGTIDIFYLELSCVVAVAPESGFELVSAGKVEYLAGEELDISKLQLNAIYENGKTDSLPLENVTIDTSKVDMSKEGVYDVVIKYKEYPSITYQVSVFAPASIELGFDAIEKLGSNTAAGNGVYYNHSFKEFYFLGEELDTRGLSVIVIAKCGDRSVEFKVDDYTIEGFNSAEEGEQTLTISSNGVSATTTVHVADVAITPDADGIVKALVDPAYLSLRGHLSGPYHVFSTIQQALDFLAHVDAAVSKELTLAPGYYNEKLEITIPNLTIIGSSENSEDIVIEWDSLYGLVDAGGFVHTTDSTATVAVREQAINCEIKGVTISNYWNTQERLDEAGLAIERNLALLVQADRFIMKDSRLLAIQDTLELFTGRQYFENVFISGYTDFIFGTNNTTYFKNCTIHTIDTSKDDGGTAGYLTAFKGSNKGADDAILYGAIFDGCKFTADEGVMEGKTAIGRTWGAYAAVAVINSEIGGHISLDGYDKAENKNKRYISMNGIHPTDETVQFVEYNNTGAGAITEAVAGMKMLTAEEAVLYADFDTIFGKINRNVQYLDSWDPMSDEVAVDDRDYYYFNGGSSATGTSHTFDTTTTISSGSTLEWDGLLISAENGKVAWNSNANALNMKAGAFIKFSVKAGTTVTVETYPKYNYFTLNGVGTASANMLSQYYAEDTEVTLLSTGDLYIYSIIIDPNSEAPEASVITEIKVSGMKVDYMVGDEISLDGVSVNAIYSDNSMLPVEYTVDTSAVNKEEAGEYEVVFKVGETEIKVTVNYIADLLIDETTTIDLSETGANIQKTVGKYKQLTVDATNGKFADNGSGWVQVNAGTIITMEVLNEAQVSVVAYSSADNFSITVADGICTITCLANDYLKSITVEYEVVFGEATTIDLSATGANIQGSVADYKGLTVDATSGKFADNGSGWVQVNAGTIITLNVASGATVTVSAYSSADNFSITVADGICTITCLANDYLKSITVGYVVVFGEATTIDLSATGANIQGSVADYKGLTVDATNGKFADNNGGWVQVNAGTIITLNVASGATVTVSAYSNAANFTIETVGGVCTITCVGNDYLNSITVSFE